MDAYPSIASLEAVHTFPCRFIIKAIGDNEPSFVEAVREAAEAVVGSDVQDGVVLNTRLSSKGNHVSVTLNVAVETPEDVQNIYGRLKAIETPYAVGLNVTIKFEQRSSDNPEWTPIQSPELAARGKADEQHIAGLIYTAQF